MSERRGSATASALAEGIVRFTPPRSRPAIPLSARNPAESDLPAERPPKSFRNCRGVPENCHCPMHLERRNYLLVLPFLISALNRDALARTEAANNLAYDGRGNKCRFAKQVIASSCLSAITGSAFSAD